MGYITEGERTIDNQSEQAGALHMITVRVILPQFTMIGRNWLRMGTRILHSSLSRDLKAKRLLFVSNRYSSNLRPPKIIGNKYLRVVPRDVALSLNSTKSTPSHNPSWHLMLSHHKRKFDAASTIPNIQTEG